MNNRAQWLAHGEGSVELTIHPSFLLMHLETNTIFIIVYFLGVNFSLWW